MKTQKERDKRRKKRAAQMPPEFQKVEQKKKPRADISVSVISAEQEEEEERARYTRRAFMRPVKCPAPATAAARARKNVEREKKKLKKIRAILRVRRDSDRADIGAVLERASVWLSDDDTQTDDTKRRLASEQFRRYTARAIEDYTAFDTHDLGDEIGINNRGTGRNSRAYVLPRAAMEKAASGTATAHDLRDLAELMDADHRNDWPTHDLFVWLGYSREAVRYYAQKFGQEIIFRNNARNYLRYGIATYYALRPRPADGNAMPLIMTEDTAREFSRFMRGLRISAHAHKHPTTRRAKKTDSMRAVKNLGRF